MSPCSPTAFLPPPLASSLLLSSPPPFIPFCLFLFPAASPTCPNYSMLLPFLAACSTVTASSLLNSFSLLLQCLPNSPAHTATYFPDVSTAAVPAPGQLPPPPITAASIVQLPAWPCYHQLLLSSNTAATQQIWHSLEWKATAFPTLLIFPILHTFS